MSEYDKDIVIIGDTHGMWHVLNPFVNKKRPDIILSCGDFGYWPRWKEKQRCKKWPKNKIPKVPDGCKLYFCDGNHEDHEMLLQAKDNELYPNVHYQPRGSTMRLPDGRQVLFFGGALSIDKSTRKWGIDWFPEEQISHSQIHNLDVEGKVDIVISHTCPREFEMTGYDMKVNDCNRMALSYILQIYQPSLWYFGHWHRYTTGFYKGCRWTCLDMFHNPGYQTKQWEYLRK